MSISPASSAHAPAPAITPHSVEVAVERTGMGVLATAGVVGAVSPLHALPAVAYGAGVAGGHFAEIAHPNALGTHLAGAAEGLIGAFGHGSALHGAAAATAAPLAAKAAPGAVRSMLGSAARVMGRVVPAVVAGVGLIDVTKALDDGGPRSLVTTTSGRNGAINALGGGLLLVPHPAAKLAGAGLMMTGIVNDFDKLSFLDSKV